MCLPQRFSGLLARCLLAAGLVCGSGCLGCLHPVPPPLEEQAAPCRQLPKCARDHVYVFIANGLDPVNAANLTGVRDYVQALGFRQTYFGQLYHALWFEHALRRIHHEDPDARLVFIGFSLGGDLMYAVAQAAQQEHIHVDLLVYLDGVTVWHDLNRPPENVARTVNLVAPSLCWSAGTLADAENYRIDSFWHFGLPSHPGALAVLARELAAVAATVPVPPEPAEPEPETAPTPRPVMPHSAALHDEWDFIRPATKDGYHSAALEWKTEPPPARSPAQEP